MRALSAGELLHVWEQGVGQENTQLALLLLLAACPESTPEDLARLTIGERDGRLMTLREWAFGSRLESVVYCPQCAEQLELSFNLADIRASVANQSSVTFNVQVGGFDVSFRLPNSMDLLALSSQVDRVKHRQALLATCILLAKREGVETPVTQLPADVLDVVVARMAEQDPQADVQLSLTCPACKHKWSAPFDIVSFFWSEICTWAQRIFREVHQLAFTYGWREIDILAMSPRRRQLYLAMIGG